MLPVSTVYALFFGAAVFVLFLIFCAKMPELWRSWRRFARQMVARRTREERMLADLEKLMAEARRLEGIYCFERFEPHHAPSKAGLARKAMESALESIAC
jgi:hypothetical protein